MTRNTNIIKLLIAVFIFFPIRTIADVNSDSLFDLPLKFQDESGAEFVLSSLKGSPIIASMVYLSCSTSCPITIHKLKIIDADFKKEGITPQIVVGTFDPNEDTVKKLSEFKQKNKLGDNWHFIRASEDEIHRYALILGFNYRQIEGTKEFEHSNRIVMLDKEGRVSKFVDRLDADHSAFLVAAKE